MNDINQDTDYSRRGPWDDKLKEYVKEHFISVLIHDIETDIIEHEFKLDLGNSDDKKFLGKVTFWATSNGRSVETMSVEEWEKMNK